MNKFKMIKLAAPTLCLIFSMLLLSQFVGDLFAESYGHFLGWKNCKECHEIIVSGWQQTGHATAYDSLKKTEQQSLPACLKCHVTGYEESGGFIDYDLTPELEGVQCEECHGPGKNHAAEPGKAGIIVAKPNEEVCRRCHTYGQDSGFNYARKAELVHKH